MNILVIGNGFDLAHNLPTKYSHFLHFIRECMKPNRSPIFVVKPNGLDDKFHNYFVRLEKNDPHLYHQLISLTKNNIWVEHFLSILKNQENRDSNYNKDGWIDFESEISKIIKALDEIRLFLIENSIAGNVLTNLPHYRILKDIFYPRLSQSKEGITQEQIEDFKTRSLDDLNRLIRCLEIYLCDYVQTLPVNQLEDIKALDIDYILSFNYTNTAEHLYHGRGGNPIVFDYIHGKANIDHSIDTCNMVLGIDEYLPEGQRDSDNEFIEFKKFFQRIYKSTGNYYKDWLECRYRKNRHLPIDQEEELNIYIYGHSLDVTDRDILSDLILEGGAKTTIFYYNKRDLSQKIANLVKVIGEEKVIARTDGRRATIFFKETTKEK